MPFEKLEHFTKKVSDLSDKPNATMTATEVKEHFDAAPDEVRIYLNKLINKMQSTTDGDSGADNIGVTPIATSPDKLQGMLEWLKTQLDNVLLGQIPDGTIVKPVEFGQHKADDTAHVYYADDTGTANAKVVSLSPAPTVYKKGLGISFTNLAQNTGAVTINVNGLGEKPLVNSKGHTLISGSLAVNGVYSVRFNGTSFILQGEGGNGNALASDLLSGKTANTDVGDIVGTMANRGAPTLLMTSANGVSIPAGYYSGGTAKLSIVAGDLLAYEDLASKSTSSQNWVKVKEVRIETAGTYRIRFDLSHNNTSLAWYNVHGRIYKNGSPFGSWQTATLQGSGNGYSPGYQSFTQDLTFEAGSLCQLYLRGQDYGGSPSTYTITLRLTTGMPPLAVKIL